MTTPEQPMSTLPADSEAETHLQDDAVAPDRVRRANPPVSTWVWVTIALLAVVLGLGLAALSFHGGGAASGKAVADIQQLMDELTTLNASLATTNSILASGIQTSSEVSAKANAQLEELSANLAGLQAGIGDARATMGPQLKAAVRKRLANAQAELQSRTSTLAGHQGRLSQQLLTAVQGSVGALTSKVGSETRSGTERTASLEGQIRALRAEVGRQASAQDRLESTLGHVPARIDRLKSDLRHQLAAERLRLHHLMLLVQQLRARPDRPSP